MNDEAPQVPLYAMFPLPFNARRLLLAGYLLSFINLGRKASLTPLRIENLNGAQILRLFVAMLPDAFIHGYSRHRAPAEGTPSSETEAKTILKLQPELTAKHSEQTEH